MEESIPSPCVQTKKSKEILKIPAPSPLQRLSTQGTWPCDPPPELAHLQPLRTLDRTEFGRTKLVAGPDKTFYSVKLHEKKGEEKDSTHNNLYKKIKRENEVLRQIEKVGGHPNIIRLIAECETDSHLWSAWEFSGSSLLDFLVRQEKGVDEKLAKAWTMQILGAVEFMHKHGFCHLNLNLDNIYIFGGDSQDSFVKLGGFSCATQLPSSGQFGSIKESKPGKLEYMAPEIFAGLQFNGVKADIYSLGVILFELLTGHPAYQQPSPGDSRFRYMYEGKLATLLQAWGDSIQISPEAVNLLNSVVCKPEKRISISDFKNHDWYKS
mmetsp:Transcript_28576/g.56159  ORF Transcript_28576/g.56159 Transcript_28576/m.56159 type:complete len:324 (-) Transcript_28576:118-1089(-)|eukprot:CAMPEP_0175146328 /NCGR_PEP_ID=MMETSP0087-20121206/15323_1 /TAXON_ID=136419 /ORGANISM="Unknown Unknown, Strain D1" /LENGTH=323 /DNA_ID=CAMNT_0016431289 /DNA_START=22 /DNA_END=993 /DNA_ORIENTATION=+